MEQPITLVDRSARRRQPMTSVRVMQPQAVTASPAAVGQRPGTTRSLRERVIQTLWFEGLGLVIVAPVFAYFSGAAAGDSFLLLTVLAFVATLWSGSYNAAFDRAESHLTGRVASDRSHGWRVLHAFGLETSLLALTWPLVVALTPLGWTAALVAEIGLTLAYLSYGYAFHMAFDRLRPIHAEPRSR
jgi:uncharacterized membrane protein